MKYQDPYDQAIKMKKDGVSTAEIGRRIGVPRTTVVGWFTRGAKPNGKAGASNLKDVSRTPARVADDGGRHTYILTFAQNEGDVHKPFLRNLEAYAASIPGCRIIIGVGWRLQGNSDKSNIDPDVLPHINYDRASDAGRLDPMILGKNVLWLSGVRIGMGTINPVSDIGNGAGQFHGCRAIIVPNPTPALTMVHGIKPNEVRQVYSTGSITGPDAGTGKAGYRAMSHWSPSALILETEGDSFWVRQLEGDPLTGSFSDLRYSVYCGTVAKDEHRPLAIVSADCHFSRMQDWMWGAMYGGGGILDVFKPHNHIMHDILDGFTVNRHERQNRFRNFRRHVVREQGVANNTFNPLDTVEQELCETAGRLHLIATRHKHTTHHVIVSNHDQWLRDWAHSHDASRDPHDLEEWHRVNLDILTSERMAVEDPDENVHYLKRVLYRHGMGAGRGMEFVGNGAGLRIGDVEYSCHGDKGLSGAAGSIAGFSRATGKITVAHSHSPAILWDAHRVGMGAELNQGYNVGMTNWAHSFGIHYFLGGRAIVTMCDNRWFRDETPR